MPPRLCFVRNRQNLYIVQKLKVRRQHRRRLMCCWLLLESDRVKREFWVHPINAEEEREKGEFFQLYRDMRKFPMKFYKWYRMTPTKFDELLELVREEITPQINNYREALSAEEKLVITLT